MDLSAECGSYQGSELLLLLLLLLFGVKVNTYEGFLQLARLPRHIHASFGSHIVVWAAVLIQRKDEEV